MSGTDNPRWVLPAGAAARDGWQVVVDDTVSGWSHTSLAVAQLAEGESVEVPASGWEHVVVPLSGSVTVACDLGSATLAGRGSVFDGATDVAYVTRDTALTVSAAGGRARVAVCGARAEAAHEPGFRHVATDEVAVELRGAGAASREVRNFATPAVLGADSLIACEVVTPAGNWSSYPPHKHDEERPGAETELEEIYWFEVGTESGVAAPIDADPVAYHRVFGTKDRPIDVLAEVRTGDVVLVPHGWHGPTTAPPGYDLYYLNVMAGPGRERAWLICDHPAHGWVRQAWREQDVDPRLPTRGR
jgi:5-deoxy-glucuronate isomerase